jgi:DNA processing protein
VLLWDVGSASEAVRAIVAGRAGSDADRRFLADVSAAQIRRVLDRAGARFAAPGHPDYWPAFARLEDPPVGVFVRGIPLEAGDRRVAIVGTRRPTSTGREVATALGRGLADGGVVVVSGAALGIDAAAHRGALEAGGVTIAVLGCGIDVAHPRSNAALVARIAEEGTLVSEYPPGVSAEPHRFPARNRLIAALSEAVVVVEGASRSGTRITAEHASELGLDVFVVPGAVTNPLAETPLALLRDGATPIRDAADLLHDLGLEAVDRARPRALSAIQERVFAAVTERVLPDVVARGTRLPLGDVVTALVELELRGLIRCVGGRYERTFGSAASRMVDDRTA